MDEFIRDVDALVFSTWMAEGPFGDVVLAGCGSGRNAVKLADKSRRLLALDGSGEVLERVRRRVEGDHVHFEKAELGGHWPGDDEDFDAVFSSLVLDGVGDLTAWFGQVDRLLRPGGVAYLSEPHPAQQYEGGEARAEREPEFVHDLTDFIHAADNHGLALAKISEHRLDEAEGQAPRVLELWFRKF